MYMEITSHQFPGVYKALGVDLDKLGCIMLDLKPLAVTGIAAKKKLEADDALYHSADKAKFWLQGWVFGEPHVTLLYGLMSPGNEAPMKGAVDEVLEDWKRPMIEVDHVGFFESKNEDEPYYCLIAHVVKSPELMEGNERLKMLPHIDTFPGYKPHATIAYIKKSKGETYRDEIVAALDSALKGARLSVTKINHGGNKG